MLLPFSLTADAYDSAYNNDLVEPFFVTDPEDQGENGDCLYYALTATAESFVVKYYGEKVNFDESELDLGNAEFSGITGIIEGKELLTADATDATYRIAGAEKIDINYDDYCSEVKKAIKEYGAVTAVFRVCPDTLRCGEHYNKSTYTYSYEGNEDDITHAVSVVGWDDKDGVWICKNSYGVDFGYCGFFRLSYQTPLQDAVKFKVLKNGEEDVEITTDLNWETDYITAVFVQEVRRTEGKNTVLLELTAYCVNQKNEFIKCAVFYSEETNYYEISPPGNSFMDKNTACYLNGEKLQYGDDNSNDPCYEFDEESGKIFIKNKEKGALFVNNIETPPFGLSYILLTYDNGSKKIIFSGRFEENGIEVCGKYDSKDAVPAEFEIDTAGLADLGENQKYVVLRFTGNGDEEFFSAECYKVVVVTELFPEAANSDFFYILSFALKGLLDALDKIFETTDIKF